MKKLKNLFNHKGVTVSLLVVAIALFIFSGVQTTRAAVNAISNNADATLVLSELDLTLMENHEPAEGNLLDLLVPEGETFKVGYPYEDSITVQNSGAVEQYVRCVVYTYWLDKDGNKVQDTDGLIDIVFNEDNWAEDTDAKTDERRIFYYTGTLAPEAETASLVKTVGVKNDVLAKGYDGYQMVLEVEADAVQVRHGYEAVCASWGTQAASMLGLGN